ncbi:MAG: ABC transporter permease [Verrucomicrobia bacterium]|jgi:peptide/nickel transport system permease protein/oligopeptide transport system permease protein|nr:ABC transporter permease [Verrucomicrobiota bacterium]
MLDPRVLHRVKKNPAAVVSAAFLAFIVLACVVGPEFLSASLGEPGPNQYAPPSWEHPFGTDLNGRDVLYRVLTGGRISLLVGLCGAVVSLFIGTAWGLIAGYAGGRVDALMMRVVDILYSVPRLIFILIAINAFNAGLQEWASQEGLQWLVQSSRIAILILTLGFIEWLTMARIVRGQVLSLKERQFVTAARALGQSHTKILTRHLLPNLAGIILVYLTLTIPAVVIDESFLSFLGLGIQAPQASWGSLLADGAGAINPLRSFWWLLVFPAAAMSLTLLALNFLGDALRDAFDTRGR